MIDLADKIILFIASMAIYTVYTGYGISIIPVILAVTTASLCSYFEKPAVKLILTIAYFTACLFNPDLLIFLPLVCYDIFTTRYQLLGLLALIPLAEFLDQFSKILLVMILIILSFSYVLRYRTAGISKLHTEFKRYRDKSKENSILLESKNKYLMEKQDYEINVATLNERNRIAMEIHDNVGHLLSRCLLQLGAVMAVNKEEGLKASLSSIKDTLSHAMDSIRKSVHNLHDESIDLYAQINNLVKNFSFCSIHLEYDISENIDTKIKYCFIAVVKEALSNVIKHSKATQVNISMYEHPALYQLIIQDNGKVTGFNTDNGIGLSNIAERIGAFSGNYHINTDDGFRIFISIPKSNNR